MKNLNLVTTNILFIIFSVLLGVLPLMIGFIFSNVTEGMKRKKKKNKKYKKCRKCRKCKKCKICEICKTCPPPKQEAEFVTREYNKLFPV